jgi:hypothetical protein
MIKSIWEKIKLSFERKPAGDVQLPKHEVVIETPPVAEIKIKRKYVRKAKV